MRVPPHFHGEVSNAVYQQFRRKNLSLAEAALAVNGLLAMELVAIAPQDLPRAAFDFAAQHDLAGVYDAMYVVLANRLSYELWTDDQRLLRALGGTFPNVRWIGDYESP